MVKPFKSEYKSYDFDGNESSLTYAGIWFCELVTYREINEKSRINSRSKVSERLRL